MLAGPNGAGKSTFYSTYLANSGVPYLNPDALTTFDPDMSGEQIRVAAEGIRTQLFDRRESFILETVFSDTVGAKLGFLRKAIRSGYEIHLIYIGLFSAVLSEKRVEARVEADGHDAPRAKLPSRFERSLNNLDQALAFVPEITIYDNSRADEPYRLVAEIRRGKLKQKPGWADAVWFNARPAVLQLLDH